MLDRRFSLNQELHRRLHMTRNATVLQIACGGNSHLSDMYTKFRCNTYGMDPDHEMVEKAKDQLTAVIRGEPGYNTFIASRAFSLIILPTMSQIDDYDHLLRWSAHKLVKNGMVAIRVHGKDLTDFYKTALTRFDVVDHGMHDRMAMVVLQLHERFVRISDEIAIQQARSTSTAGFSFYSANVIHVPDAPEREVKPFKTFLRSREELVEMLERSTLSDEALSAVTRTRTARDEVPPLPLKQGHIALQLATGSFNGVVGSGENRHVVKGRVVRTPLEREEEDMEGHPITITEDMLSVEITALDRQGRVQHFSSAGEEDAT